MWFRSTDFTTNAIEQGTYVCWPFLQSCGDWYFLSQFPLINTHGLLYTVLFFIVSLTAFMMYRGDYVRAHMLLVLMFLWEAFVLISSMSLAINQWYFHIVYAALFLFSTNKLLALRLGAVLLYLMCGVIKLDPAWIAGGYFWPLAERLYFVLDPLLLVFTNGALILELFAVWFLFSSRALVRNTVLAFIAFFHTYSVIYVGYLYPVLALPIAVVLFADPTIRPPKFIAILANRAAIAILGLFLIWNALPLLISGSARATGEGNKYGMYMFEANYQCRFSAEAFFIDGTSQENLKSTEAPNHRCDPYIHWFRMQQTLCNQPDIVRVSWTLDTSLNGAPFMRIVDTDNVCALTYKPFSHNDWIARIGIDEVEVLDYPVLPNHYPTPKN